MIRILFFIVLISGILNATELKSKIQNLIGKNEFKIHNHLINNLFHNENNFKINGQINYLKVFQVLTQNGLMDLKLDKPKNIKIEFKINENHLNAYKILHDTIQLLGYRHVITKLLKKNSKNELIWVIEFKTEYMLNSYLLIKELKRSGCIVQNINKIDSQYWEYELNFKSSYIYLAKSIPSYERIVFNKPLSPILIKSKKNKKLEIKSRHLNRWYPHIVFYDKKLEIIKTYKKNLVTKKLKINIPKHTTYIMINDIYNLVNIKRGLTVIVR